MSNKPKKIAETVIVEKQVSNILGPSVDRDNSQNITNDKPSLVKVLKDKTDQVARKGTIKARKIQEGLYFGGTKEHGCFVTMLVPEEACIQSEDYREKHVLIVTSEIDAAKSGLPVVAYAPEGEYFGWTLIAGTIEVANSMTESIVNLSSKISRKSVSNNKASQESTERAVEESIEVTDNSDQIADGNDGVGSKLLRLSSKFLKKE